MLTAEQFGELTRLHDEATRTEYAAGIAFGRDSRYHAAITAAEAANTAYREYLHTLLEPGEFMRYMHTRHPQHA